MDERRYATQKLMIDEEKESPDPNGRTEDSSLRYRQVEQAAKEKLDKALSDKPSISGGNVI